MPQSAAKIESMESTLSQAEKAAIAELAFPIQRILNQIEPELKEGAYRVIIGDDVSGRIPAIIMNEAVRKIYKMYGHPSPMLRFIAGGRRHRESGIDTKRRTDDMRDRTMQLNGELQQKEDTPRALLVTEAVASGWGMQMILSALKNERIKTDVAALGFAGGVVDYGTKDIEVVRKRLRGARLIIGTENLPSLYEDRDLRILQGVAKEHGSSTSTRLTDHQIHREEVPGIQAKINAARVLAIKVGGEVADIHLIGKEKQAA